jgi:phage-related protein/predicted XRE-type DNA-binding protein
MDDEKQIRWVGSAYADLLAFPEDARKEAGFQLGKVQARFEPADWKPFDDVGAGTREIRIRDASPICRVLYVAKFEEAIYVLHCLPEEDSGNRQARQEMKIDTEISHVTRPGANLFLELGFSPDEAKRLKAASRKQINDARLLKQQLMEELSGWIAEHHLKQSEAAQILMVSRPRVSDVVNRKTSKFTIDTLVEMLSRVGKPVKLAIS